MTRLFSLYCRSLEAVMAVLLALMVLMVFTNVVLRYGFNSGIPVSEEVSRWLFVWMTFLGAIVAVREHAHLGTDALIRRLPVWGKKVCLIVSHGLMLYATWLLLSGSWQQTLVNWDVRAPTSGASVAIFYFVGVIYGVSAIVFLFHDLWRALTGQLREDELVMVHESEEQADIDRINAEIAHRDANERLPQVGNGSDTRGS
ncbi:TRAP transporter small permease [uncultured Xylophilus sp.]|uniref:TRAP transporter small permease n=1 Tax=uncultured Xylophilus sp. TaxID=296832 RepID=UPI0025D14E94|nr:TRAP transporter small permease [uncultured Xylophilus sp.]